MRILWITLDVFEPFFPFAKGKPTKTLSWTTPLFFNLNKEKDVKLGSIATVLDGQEQKKEIANVIYYSIPVRKKDNITRMRKKLADKYLSAICDFQPDIIHIHGIERNFSLLRNFLDPQIPIVCSIQGIIQPCLEYMKLSVANLNLNRYKSIKNRIGRGGVSYAINNWEKYSIIEKEIFKINEYFIGRTSWDKAQLAAYNPEAQYYHGEELLRTPFYSHSWDINTCERHRIFISSVAEPIKGFHVLLKAAAILKNKYSDIKIVAPLASFKPKLSVIWDFLFTEDYANYLKKEIIKSGLEDNIILYKKLSADEMADEYCKAHVFSLTSYIENSPNSLGEAMLVGTPSIVSPVGGVISIVKDEESSLYFPSGDAVMLAFQIDRIFSDDQLAVTLSRHAKTIALKRHDIAETTSQYINIYAQIIKKHTEKIKLSSNDFPVNN